VSSSFTHFKTAEKTALETAVICAVTFEIALIVQLTLDIDSILADANMIVNTDAWTLLTASDDAETFLNKIAALETELCESIVDVALKITIALQLTSDWLTTSAAALAIF
jgi:hypothetical protein